MPNLITQNSRNDVFVYGGAVGASGLGSTNTSVRKFTTVDTNIGSAITYNSSATLGDTFTINEDGMYSFSTGGQSNVGQLYLLITANSSGAALTGDATAFLLTGITHITATGFVGSCSGSAYLTAGTVVRSQVSNSNCAFDTGRNTSFRITKVG